MRRILTPLLLLCMLGSNLAWAWDTHGRAAPTDTGPQLIAASDLGDPGAAGDGCHYCCCGVAHVLGLPTAQGFRPQPARSVLVRSEAPQLLSHPSIPPTRPPRV